MEQGRSDSRDATRTLLAIESSTDWLSVALLRGEEVLALEVCEESRQHASAILPAVDSAMRVGAMRLEEIDAIGISTGPGSFTSLRIGLATVKGLAFDRPIEGVGISTLEAMALSVLETSTGGAACDVVALLDARRGQWYAGGWSKALDSAGMPEAILPEGLYAPHQLAEDIDDPVTLMSPELSGWQRGFDQLSITIGSVVEGAAAHPRADWVGRLAQRRLDRGEGVPVAALGARYLRRAEAEAKRLGGPVEEGEIARLGDPGR